MSHSDKNKQAKQAFPSKSHLLVECQGSVRAENEVLQGHCRQHTSLGLRELGNTVEGGSSSASLSVSLSPHCPQDQCGAQGLLGQSLGNVPSPRRCPDHGPSSSPLDRDCRCLSIDRVFNAAKHVGKRENRRPTELCPQESPE